jgi:hypothetical protein
MRSRLLAGIAALVLVVTGLTVVASPASAHCGGHEPHPDRYSAGGISFKSGARIRGYPHTYCAVRGLGYPNHGIDVHCWTEPGPPGQGNLWYFVRNTSTGVNGWARYDALNYRFEPGVLPCT